jgi:hypothetical protein
MLNAFELLPLHTTGFYRSYHVDIKTQRNLVLLALKRNTSGGLSRYVITRPSTGTSPFELDDAELHAKYKMVSEDSLDSVQAAWTQVSTAISLPTYTMQPVCAIELHCMGAYQHVGLTLD